MIAVLQMLSNSKCAQKCNIKKVKAAFLLIICAYFCAHTNKGTCTYMRTCKFMCNLHKQWMEPLRLRLSLELY